MKQKQIETALATIVQALQEKFGETEGQAQVIVKIDGSVCLDDQESGIIREDSPAEHVAEDLAK